MATMMSGIWRKFHKGAGFLVRCVTRGPPVTLMWVCLCLALLVILQDLTHPTAPAAFRYEPHDLDQETSIVQEEGDDDEPNHEVIDSKDGNLSNAITTYQPRTCDRCFARNYQYLLNPKDACQMEGSSVLDLVIIIPSRPGDVWLRNTLRETWLRYTKVKDVSARYVFLLGDARDDALQEAVAWEHNTYGDLVQQNFVDSYENLTLKTMMGLDWAVAFCHQAKVVLKADTDVFVNLPRLISVTRKFPEFNSIRGLCQSWSKPMRTSKWGVTHAQYPQEVYPPFCKGPRYFMPMRVARAIVAVSPNRPFLRLEDVYLGTCLYGSGYKTWSLGRLSSRLNLNKMARGEIHYRCQQIDSLLSSHPVGDKTLRYVWDLCFKNKTLTAA